MAKLQQASRQRRIAFAVDREVYVPFGMALSVSERPFNIFWSIAGVSEPTRYGIVFENTLEALERQFRRRLL